MRYVEYELLGVGYGMWIHIHGYSVIKLMSKLRKVGYVVWGMEFRTLESGSCESHVTSASPWPLPSCPACSEELLCC